MLSGTARAAEWPERPIRMIIPFAPGAGADIVGRTFAEELAKALGQPVVVDNKGGAGGLLGAVEGVRAAPDGYTLLLTSQGITVWNLGLYKSPGYDPLKDLVPITVTGELPNVLAVAANNPANSVADLVAQAKAKPGELTYGSSGVGSSLHLSGVILEQRTGARLQHVPYRGAPAAVLAVVNGEVTMGFFNTPTVLPQIKAGKVKALAVTSGHRSPLLPDGADHEGGGRARLRRRRVAGLRRAGRHAGQRRPALQHRDQPHQPGPEGEGKLLVQGFEMLPRFQRRPRARRSRTIRPSGCPSSSSPARPRSR